MVHVLTEWLITVMFAVDVEQISLAHRIVDAKLHGGHASQRIGERLVFEIHAMDQQTVASVKEKLQTKLEALVKTKKIIVDDDVALSGHCLTTILGLASDEVTIDIGEEHLWSLRSWQ
jgi:hypothetical protein